MIKVEVDENGGGAHRFTAEQGRRLAASGIVAAAPSPFDPDVWNVTAKNKVGVARVGDVEVWIRPKLEIERLLFLIGYANDPSGWQHNTVGLDVRDALVPAIAQALWRQAERALQQGLMQGYRVVEESSYVLRGRLREADQLRRHYGMVIPMEIQHDDFTIDVPENQILLAAITRMLAVPRVDDESRRRLAALRVRLAEVTTLVRGARLPAWRPTRLNSRYHTALRLAEIVWRATSPEHTPGSVSTNGFLFDLAKIFEDFVTVSLRENLHQRHGGSARTQFPCFLDDARTVRMKPDLVWQVAGRPSAVVDAKYKQEKSDRYPNADLYQLLAYCMTLGLSQGHLVYARGNANPARHVVRQAGVLITCHALDLTQPPERLLAQIGQLTEQVAAGGKAA